MRNAHKTQRQRFLNTMAYCAGRHFPNQFASRFDVELVTGLAAGKHLFADGTDIGDAEDALPGLGGHFAI